jgi:SAM-dependent methyltransferase
LSEAPLPRALLHHASAYYRAAGRFAWHFARAKLHDPAFRAILTGGYLAQRQDLLDLGAGQGLLAAWLLAAQACHASERAGDWPRNWPVPPQLRTYTGIEINPHEVRRARRAFALDTGSSIRIVHADIREADYGHPDAIVLLDVLHYFDFAAQESVLQRARRALPSDGVLLMRIGDRAGGLPFTLSTAVDRSVALARRGSWLRLYCRPLRQWQELLKGLGFASRAIPMTGATYSNALLLAQPL